MKADQSAMWALVVVNEVRGAIVSAPAWEWLAAHWRSMSFESIATMLPSPLVLVGLALGAAFVLGVFTSRPRMH